MRTTQEPNTRQGKRIATRKQGRKEARKKARARAVKEWSANRPKPSDADMSDVQLMAKLVKDGTGWQQANKTGLGVGTIYRFRNGKAYEPRHRTLQMIARANGGRFTFVMDN